MTGEAVGGEAFAKLPKKEKEEGQGPEIQKTAPKEGVERTDLS